MPRHIRVFLSSPGDVSDERGLALDVLDGLPYDLLKLGLDHRRSSSATGIKGRVHL